jgi:hypothetical protein
MVKETAAQLGTGHHTTLEMITTLGLQKVCSHWAPHLLKNKHKKTCLDVSSELLQQHIANGDNFLFNNVTDDENWFHHINPEIKQQSMEWHHMMSPRKKVPRTAPLASRVI